MMDFTWPPCPRCNKRHLLPLSDYGEHGASVLFKAWACPDPSCGYAMRIDKGDVSYGARRAEPRAPFLHAKDR